MSNTILTKLDVSGMHCASCSLLIKKSLESQKGVVEASVNYSTGNAVVKHESSVIESQLITAVTAAGYGATVKGDKSISESQKRSFDIRYWSKKLFFSTLLALPLAVFMVYDFFPFLSYRSQIMPYAGIISFISSTIALFFVGRNFFQGAVSALRLRTFTMDSLIATGTSAAYLYSLYEALVDLNIYQFHPHNRTSCQK